MKREAEDFLATEFYRQRVSLKKQAISRGLGIKIVKRAAEPVNGKV